MKFLTAVHPDYVPEAEKPKYAVAGEPVIPWYPAPLDNMFVSTVSFKKTIHAVVRELPEFDADVALASLVREYPGLPPALHENYLYHTARAAMSFPEGTVFRIYIKPDTARLHEVGGEERLFTLWEKQPLTSKG
jgi:hypothetical protein